MKKLLMMMAVAVGLTSFAAQNDRLISFYTEGPDKYEDGTTIMNGERCALVWVKTGSVFGGFASVDDDNYRVLEYASCGLNGHFEAHVFRVAHELDLELDSAGDYQVLVLDTRNEQKDGLSELVNGVPARINDYKSGLGTTQEQVEEFNNFLLPGPDHYSDGMLVREGEIYALVWMKEGAAFKGFRNSPDQNVSVVCVDEEINRFACVYGRADSQGKCVKDDGVTLAAPQGYEHGHFAIYLMDTRKPGTNELTDRDNGNLPMFLQGYREVQHNTAAATSGWTPVKVAEAGKSYPFDPSLALKNGYAAVYSSVGGNDVWTVYEMPKAWAEMQTVNTVFETESDLYVLRAPAKPLVFPCTNEVDYVFNVAESVEMRKLIAKIVSTKGLLDAILTMKSESDLAPYADVLDAQDIALLQGGELAAWAEKVMPFFQWNADFAVSFDRGVTNGTVFLDGQYDGAAAWGFNTWVGSAFKDDLAAGEEIRLLKQGYQEVYLNYSEICTNVIQFKCGAMNLSPDNWGTRMTVKLRLYENTGRCHETKSSFTVDTYKYTFKGPLNVEYYVDGKCHAALSTNHDGRTEFPLLAYQTGNPNQAFVGWTNEYGEAVSTIPSMVHEATPETKHLKSWYAGGDDTLKLYATFKEAKQLEITVKPADGEAGEEKTTSQIKVTKEWLEEKVGEGASEKSDTDIQTALEQPVANANSDLKFWQAYLLGIDPTDPKADLKVDKTNGDEDDKALVVSTVQVVAPDAGIKIGYSLDKVDSTEKPIEGKQGEEQPTKDLKIDLEPKDDTPTGYYKMNVIFTPTDENGEEKENEKVTIPADNTIGVLKVETTEPVVPVAVPWKSLQSDEDITVDQLVKTSTLTEGDAMHVYDKANRAYRNYQLVNGSWEHVNSVLIDDKGVVTETPVDAPTDETIARGSGVWLERQNPDKPIYLIGQYKENDQASSTVYAPTEGSTRGVEYNLIAPTGITDTDLNEVLPATAGKQVNENDMIVVVRDGAPVRYRPMADGKWGYKKQVYEPLPNGRGVRVRTVDETKDTKFQAGLGMWYISAGGNPEIQWPK